MTSHPGIYPAAVAVVGRPGQPDRVISFDVTVEDQRAWMEFALAEQGRIGALRLAASLLVVLVFMILGFTLGEFAGLAWGGGIGLAAAVLGVPWLLRRSVRAQIDDQIARAPDGSIGPVSLELTSDELTWQTAAAKTTWQRRAIRRVAVRDNHAFIMFGPSNGLVIPLAKDDGSRTRFIDSLNSGGVPETD